MPSIRLNLKNIGSTPRESNMRELGLHGQGKTEGNFSQISESSSQTWLFFTPA
jgi:hypothetical protein